jgi:endonuclease YncB( thermonuclease family)
MLEREEYEFLRGRVDHILVFGRPTAWQRRFLEDMRAKLARFGVRTRLSDKQLSTLRQLAHSAHVIRKPATPRPYQRRSWMERQQRKFVSRMTSYAIGLALMAVIFAVSSLVDKVSLPGWGSKAEATTQTVSALTGQAVHQSFSIIDGDTLRLSDGSRMRLVGFNTPEKGDRAECAREAELSARATARLKQLVASSQTGVTQVACACPPGTEGTKKCNYGRSCGTLTADGRDVGDILIAEGLAVPFVCTGWGCPPTPRPWCD